MYMVSEIEEAVLCNSDGILMPLSIVSLDGFDPIEEEPPDATWWISREEVFEVNCKINRLALMAMLGGAYWVGKVPRIHGKRVWYFR